MIGLGLGLVRQAVRNASGQAWTPAQLFTNGEQGVWYEPRPQYLFQDAAGTTPVTADGDPVGLMLDKSRGLVKGPELVTNGTFDSGIEGWSAGDAESLLSHQVDRIRIENGDNNAAYAGEESITPEVGKWYEISFEVTTPFSDDARILFAGFERYIPQGSYTYIYRATGTKSLFLSNGNNSTSGEYTEWDNISVRELPGNHATQATSAARPIYRTDGVLHWLEFDGVDDVIGATYAGSLSQPNTLAMAFRYLSGVRIMGRSEGTGQGQLMSVSSSKVLWYAGELGSTIRPNSGEDTVMTGVFDGASSKYRRNGSDYQTVDSGTNGTVGPFIGADSVGSNAAEMRFYGMVSVGGDNTSELDNVQSYLANLAGVTIP